MATRPTALAIGPILLVLGIVLIFVSNALIQVGPFDRATFGWAFCVPLLATAPMASGLAGRWSSPGSTMAVASLIAVGCGVFVLGSLVATVHQIGCEPVSDPRRIAAQTLPLALAAAAAYFVPAVLAFQLRNRPFLAIVVGVGTTLVCGVAVLLLFAASFPGVTCIPVPTPTG